MKKKKIVMIVSALVCIVLAVAVVAIAFNQPEYKHKHNYSDNKTYHITNDGVYYTRVCDDNCVEKVETRLSFEEVLVATEVNDNIVLDEDIVVDKVIKLNSYISTGGFPEGYTINVNLDLNNHKITSNIDTDELNAESIKSMFILNAPYGEINFNIKNGTLSSDELSYIFNFANNTISGDSIKVNIDNVVCEVSGEKATPIFAHNNSSNIEVTANNSQFIAKKSAGTTLNTGTGAFINSESVFNFNNCYFEGGDAIHVKRGTVNLNGCEIISKEYSFSSGSEVSTDTFSVMGACLLTESYHEAEGFTKFIINIVDCEMRAETSTTMIYIAETYEDGLTKGINDNSQINIESCRFNNDPTSRSYPTVVSYSTQPQKESSLVWTVGL